MATGQSAFLETNTVYTMVWSESLAIWVPAPEITRRKGKQSRRASSGRGLGAVILMACLSLGIPDLACADPSATQLPTGGAVVSGAATISQSNAAMVIHQSSNRAAIDLQSFNVGRDASVHFNQPNAASATLNRVLDSDPSQIFGQITAPGQVFLSNPNGVYFSPSASVDVGALTATTHHIGLDDFMSGHLRFERDGATGSVINKGRLEAALGGYIALLAPEVRNEGIVIAQAGTAVMAAGEQINLQFSDGRLASVAVSKSEIDAYVENRNAVLAPDGLIILSAQAANNLRGRVINSAGASLEATGMLSSGGRIFLGGDENISSSISGTIDVSANENQGRGGSVTITGENISLGSESNIKATGVVGGGEVLIGGDWQGSGDLYQATSVYMSSGATINASATHNGDGGKVVLWSNIYNPNAETSVYGSIIAKAGPLGGDGGRIETSGANLNYENVVISASSEKGSNGLWLLDPTTFNNSTINQSKANEIGAALNTGNDVTVWISADNMTLLSDVDILKTSSGTTTLTLKAEGFVKMESGSTIKSTGGPLNVTLWSDYDGGGSGAIYLQQNAQIISNGGDITLSGGTNYTTGFARNGGGIDQGILTSTGSLISAAGGDIVLRGLTNSGSNAQGILHQGTIQTSSSGTVTLEGRAYFTANDNAVGIKLNNGVIRSAAGGIGLYGEANDKPNSAGIALEGASTIASTSGTILLGTPPTPSGGGTSSSIKLRNTGSLGDVNTTGNIQLNDMSGFSIESTFGGVRTTGYVSLSFKPSINDIGLGDGSNGDVILGQLALNKFHSDINYVRITGQNYNIRSLLLNTGLFLDNVDSITGSGTVTIPVGKILTVDANNPTTVPHQLIGGGGFAVYGDIVTLTNTNAYTGTTSIGSGATLRLGANNVLSDLTDVSVTGTFDLNNFSDSIDALTGAGSVTLGSGMLTVGANGGSGTFSGDVSGTGNFIKDGSGIQTLSGTNTYSGTTSIGSGATLRLGANNVLSDLTDVSVTGTFDLNNFSDSIDALTGAGSVTLGSGTLTVGANDGSGTFSGVISETGNFAKSGSGIQTLSGTNIYSGTTTISAGSLNITGTLNSGAYSNRIINNGTLRFDQAENQILSGVISGAGSLTKTGSGSLTLSGDNDYSGNTSISGGVLIASNDTSLGTSARGTSISSGAILDLSAVNIGSEDIGLSGTLKASTGSSSASGTITLSSAAEVLTSSNATLSLSGKLTQDSGVTGSLSKTGSGTLILTGNTNDYSGVTTVSAGTLQVGAGSASGKLGSGPVVNNASLIINRSDTINLSTVLGSANTNYGITGMGNLTAQVGGGFTIDRPISQTGAASDILLTAGYSTAAGTTSGGDVSFSGTGAVTTSNTGTFTLFSGSANTSVLDGKIAGATGVTKYKTYNSNSSAISSDVSGTRNYYYRQAPSLSVTGLTATKVYNASNSALGYTSGGSVINEIDGDAFAIGALSLSSATFNNANVGNKTLSASYSFSPVTTGGWRIAGYAVNPSTGSGTITPKTVSLSASKVYDGLLDLTGDVTISTGIGTQTLTYSGAVSSDAHVTTANKYISYIELANGGNGGLAANYQLPTLNAANAPVTITAKPLTSTASITAASKVYDGTTAATGSSVSGTVIGLVGNDSMTVDTSGVSLAFSDAHVATVGKTISASGSVAIGTLTSTGSGAKDGSSAGNEVVSLLSDYGALSQPTIASVNGTITARPLLATITNTGVTKVYDGDTAAPAGFAPTFSYSGFVSGDTGATITYADAVYNDANVLTASQISLRGMNLLSGPALNSVAGSNSSAVTDYQLSVSGVSAAITPRPITAVTGIVANDKVYDGTVTAVLDVSSASFQNIISGDDLRVGLASGVFSSVDVGQNKIVAIQVEELGGDDSSNYALLSAVSTAISDVTQKPIFIRTTNASKNKGSQDPILEYVVIGDGLVTGDFITGEPLRQLGEIAGSYSINDISRLSNANYSFHLSETGSLTILEATVEIISPAPNSVPKQAMSPPSEARFLDSQGIEVIYIPRSPPEGGAEPEAVLTLSTTISKVTAESSSGEGDVQQANRDSNLQSAGSVDSMEKVNAIAENGSSHYESNFAAGLDIVSVRVPKKITTTGVGFGFELPLEIKEIFSNTVIEVNQLSGETLPDWIKFDAEELLFKFGAVPQGDLPIQLVLRNETTLAVIVISER